MKIKWLLFVYVVGNYGILNGQNSIISNSDIESVKISHLSSWSDSSRLINSGSNTVYEGFYSMNLDKGQGELIKIKSPLSNRNKKVLTRNEQALSDRWIECDLLWFKPDNIQGSIDEYFSRISPLYGNSLGEKGIVLNPGWMFDLVACWTGDLDAKLILPTYKMPGHQYPAWTGKKFRELVTRIKKSASKYGFPNFKVAVWFWGGPKLYDLEISEWKERHPETYSNWSVQYKSPLKADKHTYAVYPKGIPKGTPFFLFFAKQMANFSKLTGIDGLEMRDFMTFRHAYGVPPHEWDEEFYQGVTAFLKELKKARPSLLCIGYNSAGPATGDLRGQGFDSEALASNNLLDHYVTESWGVAWNDYYKPHIFSCSYAAQQAYLAVTQAQLYKTNCRILPLVELSGGWEYDDAPLTRSRFNNRMQAWLYANTFYASPDGQLNAPHGFSLAFADRARAREKDSLITQEQVSFMKATLDGASMAAQNAEKAYGCRLFYNRNALLWMNKNAQGSDLGEYSDFHFSFLMNLGITATSSARIEDFNTSNAGDFPVLFTPFQLPKKTVSQIRSYAKNGGSMMIIGSTNTVDPELQNLPNTIYWVPPLNDGKDFADPDAKEMAKKINDLLKAQGLSFQNGQQLGLWPMWKSKGTNYMQIVNFQYRIEKAVSRVYKINISRKQLGLGTGPYHLEGVYDKRSIGSDSSDGDILSFSVFVPPFESFICTVEPGEAPPAPKVINNTDPRIIYNGDWIYNNKALVSFNRDEHYSLNKGDNIEFTFTGDEISVLGTKRENRGHADIFLDGKKIYTIDGYSDRLDEPGIRTSAHSTQRLTQYLNYVIPEKQVLFSASKLPKGQHTIKIIVNGTKQNRASGYRVAIDAFEVKSN